MRIGVAMTNDVVSILKPKETVTTTVNSRASKALTIIHTAEILDISRTTVYKLLGQGKLESIKIGTARRVTADSIERLLREGAN
jgi:excisionase family DNA binding protein